MSTYVTPALEAQKKAIEVNKGHWEKIPNFVSYCLLHYSLNLQYLIRYLKTCLLNAENREIMKKNYIELIHHTICKYPEVLTDPDINNYI